MTREIRPPSARLVAAGAMIAGLGVAAGAFGAHGLQDAVTPERLATWATGADYALAHGLAAILAALLDALGVRHAARAGWLFAGGTALFSGSLAALVLLDVPAFGAVTPLGGVVFLAGWSLLAWGALSRGRHGA